MISAANIAIFDKTEMKNHYYSNKTERNIKYINDKTERYVYFYECINPSPYVFKKRTDGKLFILPPNYSSAVMSEIIDTIESYTCFEAIREICCTFKNECSF